MLAFTFRLLLSACLHAKKLSGRLKMIIDGTVLLITTDVKLDHEWVP